MEYYHREAETMRARYNDVFLEKERLEQEVNSVRCCLEDERKEMAELRRQQQVRRLFAEDGFVSFLRISVGLVASPYVAQSHKQAL